MFARKRLLLALLSVVLLSAVAYAARAPVDANAPITMTKGMYADLLCIAASEFEPYKGGFAFSYDPASDTVRATHLPPTRASTGTRSAQDKAYGKTTLQECSELRMKSILPKLQQHVSPAATPVFEGF